MSEPYTIVLTEETAKKLFGTTDPIGKTITFKKNSPTADELYVITGILKDVPKFSHLQFDALGSFSTLNIQEKNNNEVWQWDNIWSNFVYVILPQGRSATKLQANLNSLSNSENAVMHDNKVNISLQLQPVKDIVLERSLENEFSKRVPLIFVRILVILSALVLLSAFFNYSNLSIARSLQRSHEIAIRKVNGAKRTQVLVQFIVEAIIISLISLIVALVMFMSMRPLFFSQFPDLRSRLSLDISPMLLLIFIMFGILTGLLAGSLTGFYFAKVSALRAIKNNPAVIVYPRLNMRKVLMIIQYIFSLIFITSTLIFLKQYKNFVGFDLGFNTTNILNIRIQEDISELLENELHGIPEVTNTSRSFMVTSIGNNYYIYSKYENQPDSVKAWYNIIDENYIPVLDFKIKYGRNFIHSEKSKEAEIIVNEKLIKQLNIEHGNTQNAIGKFITVEKQKLQIIGIVDDFHYSTLDREIGPFMFRYSNKRFHYINAKILSSDIPSTIRKIQKIWKTIDSVHPLDVTFYSDQIKRAYSQYKSFVRLIGFLAVLELLIASIGLLGMVVFSTEIRLKEIGIRKVFGADFRNLISILGRGFIFLIVVSALFAIPIVYLIFEKIILRQVRYHSPIGAFELVIGTLTVIIIAYLIIVSQIYRIARTKPSVLLRNE